jgi:hypothetical protein
MNNKRKRKKKRVTEGVNLKKKMLNTKEKIMQSINGQMNITENSQKKYK